VSVTAAVLAAVTTHSVPLGLRIGAIALAALLVPLGAWLLWGGREFDEKPLDDRGENPPPPRTRLHAFRDSLSRPSRTAIGLASVFTAYHAIAYTHPKIDLLQVPIERWWALALGVLIAVWSSLAMDRYFK
jgi:hypothetical protein